MYMTNSWDFPIYGALFAFFTLFLALKSERSKKKALFGWITRGLIVLVLALIFALQFAISFKPMAQGIAFVRAHSLWWQLLVLWGFFWLTGLVFLVSLFKRWALRKLRPENLVRMLARFLEVEIKVFDPQNREAKSPIQSPASSFRLSLPTNALIFIFLGVATLLVIIPEVIYVKDIYIPSHHRANTMFKLTYQAFILYALSAGYILMRVFFGARRRLWGRLVLFFPCLLFLSSAAVYPYLAVRSYYGLRNYRGLDGLKWMERLYPDDYKAILWLRESVKAQPVVLEAVGESYTDFARVSANTGLPTVLGWPVHEWLWRGSYDEPGKRREDVRRIYESGSLPETKQLLERYGVRYIFIGDLERKQYSSLSEEKFSKLARPVFQSGKTVVYEL